VFFVEEKQTENRVFGSNFLSMYARPSKVLTTERLVFFRDATERLVFSATIKRWRGGAGTLPFRCYFLLV
jgi:hypothetical protein